MLDFVRFYYNKYIFCCICLLFLNVDEQNIKEFDFRYLFDMFCVFFKYVFTFDLKHMQKTWIFAPRSVGEVRGPETGAETTTRGELIPA